MGPPPLNCSHVLRSSLLRADDGEPLFIAGLALGFELAGQTSRVARARALLREAGLADVEAARRQVALPAGRWLSRPCSDGTVPETAAKKTEKAGRGSDRGPEVEAGGLSPIGPLEVALILGLCGPAFYAPDRPLIWSEARLSRRLVLYRCSEFYDPSP